MRRLLLPLLVILLAAARPADAVCTAADVIACGPNCWTCVGSTCTLAKLLTVTPPAAGAACTFDFGTRDIVLASGGFTAGPNAFEIRAHSLTVDGSGTLKATGNQATPGGIITLTLGSGGLRVLATANLIDLTGAEMAGNFTAGGGTFIVQSDGDVVLAGPGIAVDGTTPNAQGGNITLTAGRYAGPTLVASGNVAMAAPLSATAKVGGCGGNVMVTANGGTIDVEDRIQVAGGFGGGSVCLQSDGNTTLGTTPSGGPLLVADATGDAGSGGCIDVVASGQIVGKNGTTGRVLARGSNAFITTDGGGCGGMISLDAAGPLTLGGGSTGGIDASGGQLGFGGTICLMTDHSGSDLTLGVPLAAGAAGLGAVGGCIDVCSAGRALLQDDIDVSADCAGGVCVGALSDISLGTPARAIRADGSSGSIDLCAGGQVTLAGPVISAAASSTLTGSPGGSVCVLANGPISADGPVDTSASGPNSGGSVDIEAGKDLNVAATATLNANGGSSGGTGGSVFLAAGVPDLPGTLMLNGLAHATGSSAPNTPGPARGNLRACMIHVGPTGVLDTRGDALAENTLVARTGITVDAGALIATSGADPKSRNFVTVPIGAPSPNPAAFTPPLLPTDVQFQPICTGPNQPPNCLIPCPDCGNGQVEYPETCDRGAGNGPCQPCSATCRTINCNDNNPCTTDTCDVLAGCQNTPIAGCTTTTTTTSTSSSTSITSTTSPTVTTSTLVSTTTTSVAPTTTTTVVVATTSTTVAPTTSTTISTSTTQPPTTATTASTSTSTTSSTTQQSTTTSFTTTTSTSSTTTFPPGCTVAPTFASVDCRLELLIGTVNVETDLGRLKIGLLKQLRRAKLRTERAQGFFSHKRASTAKSMLRDAVSAVGTFDQRLESNNGRRIVPPATDAMLLAGGERIHADLQRLLRSL